MLKKKVLDKLNEQINWEFYSSNLYLQMASWCEHQGFKGSAELLRDHAFEEMQHMYRLFDYVIESGELALLGAIDEPPTTFESLDSLFRLIYEHECFVSETISHLVILADEEKDLATLDFLKWFVMEQIEEEEFFTTILRHLEPYIQGEEALSDVDKVIGTMGKGRKIVATKKRQPTESVAA